MGRDKLATDANLQNARQLAKEAVGNRLALISALIWLGVITVLYLAVWLPQGTKGSVATLWGIGLLVPAALPWVTYPWWVARETARRLDVR